MSRDESLILPEYERSEADYDERVFLPPSGPRGSGLPKDPNQPFMIRDDYMIPVEAGQAVNRYWPDVHDNMPRGVTWHWSAGPTLGGLRQTLGGKHAERKGVASAHYGVGRTYAEGVDRYVALYNRSWHAGKNQILRWDGRLMTSQDEKGARSTIGIETVSVGLASAAFPAGPDWIPVYAADCRTALRVQPWTEAQIAMMITVGKEIQATYPHLTWRDHHGHEDLCPGYKQDVAGFPFARVLRGIYPKESIPDVWTPLRTVVARQRALIFLGYDLGSSGADGIWGNRSKAALARFERDYGIGDTPYWTTFVSRKINEAISLKGALLEDVVNQAGTIHRAVAPAAIPTAAAATEMGSVAPTATDRNA